MSDVEQVTEDEILDIDGENHMVRSSKTRSVSFHPTPSSVLSSTSSRSSSRSPNGGGSGTGGRLGHCIQVLGKVAFSTPGLVILVVFYSILGAFIFPLLEAPRELRNSAMIAKSREDCLRELWTITEKLNVLYERNWTMLVHEQLRRFEGSIISATRNGLNGGGLSGEQSMRWSFSEALLYSITVITTIGHGNLTPKTSGGKIMTIVYALIGVPLMLMCLSSLGGLLAEALQCTYSRLCCSKTTKLSKDCSGKGHEMNCNMCKYDAVVSSETKLNGYEFSSSVSDREESCQLIRNSPIKLNNTASKTASSSSLSSACIQIKTNPIIQQYVLTTTEGSTPPSSSPLKHQFNQTHQQYLSSSPQHYHQLIHPNYRTIVNCRGSATDGGGHELTTSATTYFPMPLAATSHFACNTHTNGSGAGNYNQSPSIKYHGMQLQTPLSHVKGFGPQDPHQHTATVHGIRRGKFLPKPMPQEINMLLAESEISYRPDVSNSSESCTNPSNHGSVDLMEDEEENEQNRIGCPHGTPSRIPLLSSSTGSSGKSNGMEIENHETTCGDEGENETNRRAAATTAYETSSASPSTTIIGSSPQVPITIVLFILVSYISLGTVIFSLWENWSIIDGAYFCFVTLSTIGYGDFLPQKTFHGPDVQLFACCAYLLLGLVLVAMSFSILETKLMWKCKRIAVRLKLTKD